MDALRKSKFLEEDGDINEGKWKIRMFDSIADAESYIPQDLANLAAYPFWKKSATTKHGLHFWNDTDATEAQERRLWPERTLSGFLDRMRSENPNIIDGAADEDGFLKKAKGEEDATPNLRVSVI